MSARSGTRGHSLAAATCPASLALGGNVRTCVSVKLFNNHINRIEEDRVLETYLSDTEPLFCLIGSELGREGSGLRDGCLTRAADNDIDSESHTGNLLFGFLLVVSMRPAVSP